MTLDQRNSERIRLYRESIRSAWAHGDGNSWPVKLNAAFHLFLKEFGQELIEDLFRLEQTKSLKEIARPFYNPARLYRIIDSTIFSMRRNRYSMAEQRAIVLKLLSMTKTLKYGSEFNEDGCNIIYDPVTVEQVVTEKQFTPVRSVADSQLIHRFCGLMWAYTEAICFRAHDVTKEIHGAYSHGDGKQFIVKEYLNLRPLELWPNMPLLPCNTVKIYKQYNDNICLRIDALNHLYHEGGPLVPNLKFYAIEVDGRSADMESLREYLIRVQETVATICRHIESISWNERVVKYAEIFWFRKRPLADQIGRDWHVPLQVREAIMNGAENERRRMPLSDEASARLAMLTI